VRDLVRRATTRALRHTVSRRQSLVKSGPLSARRWSPTSDGWRYRLRQSRSPVDTGAPRSLEQRQALRDSVDSGWKLPSRANGRVTCVCQRLRDCVVSCSRLCGQARYSVAQTVTPPKMSCEVEKTSGHPNDPITEGWRIRKQPAMT
jgi:hypothetical protein